MNSPSRLIRYALVLSAMLVGSAVAQDAGGIVVYNAQHDTLAKEWTAAFTAETGIKVTLRKGSDLEFANQIVAEGEQSPADVFLTENSPAMDLVNAAGLFAPVDAETLAQVPEAYRPSDGKWVGIAARSTVFVYDKTKLTEDKLPKSIFDLSDPSWKGRWAASPSGRRFPGDRRRHAGAQGRRGDRGLAEGDEGKRHRLSRQQQCDEGRQQPRGRRRASSTTTTTSTIRPRPARTAATSRRTISATRTRARLSASRAAACWPRASSQGGSAGLSQMDHRQRRPERFCAKALRMNMQSAMARPRTPSLEPLDKLAGAAGRSVEARLQDRDAADDRGGPALGCRSNHELPANGHVVSQPESSHNPPVHYRADASEQRCAGSRSR